MAHLDFTTSWDHDLCALRDEIMAAEGVTCKQAADMALGQIGALADYAASWDADADMLLALAYAPVLVDAEPEPEPPAPACETPAQRKALYHLASGTKPIRVAGGWLVPSGSRAGVIHRVSDAGTCSCEASQHGRQCWHVAAVNQNVEIAA